MLKRTIQHIIFTGIVLGGLPLFAQTPTDSTTNNELTEILLEGIVVDFLQT